MRTRMIAAAITVAAILSSMVALVSMTTLGASVAEQFCDARSLETYAAEAYNLGDPTRAGALNLVAARYLQQEAKECRAQSIQAVASVPSETTASSTPAAPPSGAPSATPTPPAKPNGSCQEYLANRPASEKVSLNSFGPQTAIAPALNGKAMEELDVVEALEEGTSRRSLDCTLLVEDAKAFGVLDTSTDQLVKTRALETDGVERERLIAEVERVMRDDFTHKVVKLAAGEYKTTYSLPGNPPVVAMDSRYHLPAPFATLVSTRKSDGAIVNRRLACGFQLYAPVGVPVEKKAPAADKKPAAAPPASTSQKPEEGIGTGEGNQPVAPPRVVVPKAPELPKPSPGMDRTEGTPVVKPPVKEETPKETPSPKPTPNPEPTPPKGGKDPGESSYNGSQPQQNQGHAPPVEGPASPPGGGQPPEQYTPPAPPAGNGGSSSGGNTPPGEPATGAPSENTPAEGCSPPPGMTTC